ncbi:trypsin-like peptidase domain-containing protein [Spirillospora sp. CA-253888]
MDRWEWRAWVGGADGLIESAAFLVTPTKVLTCAHSLLRVSDPHVGFPGLPVLFPVKRVHRISDWRRQGDFGDVVVLELAEEPGLRPAPLAGPDEMYGRSDAGVLRAHGFPRRADGNERFADVTTGPDMRQRGEWWQLNAAPGHWLEHGFSGGAVYDVRSGRVFGMVTGTQMEEHGDGPPRGRDGQMLPVSTLRRYWEELDDHLPLSWLTGPARRELRALLDGRPADDAAVERVLGRRPVRPFASAWDAVRTIAEGYPADRLTAHLTDLVRAFPDLAGWARRHLPEAAAGPAGAEPASVIVRVDRDTYAYQVTAYPWIDGARGPGPAPVTVDAAKGEAAVRRAVEDAVVAASRAVLGRQWIIEFAVPKNWLGKPFEDWHLDRASGMRMRRYPVVVRDVDRLSPQPIPYEQTRRRWESLCASHGRPHGRMHPVDCRPPRRRDFELTLEAEYGLGALVYAAKPGLPYLTAALASGIPVMLWPRAACADDDHAACERRGLREELVARLRHAHPRTLPELVFKLRMEALRARDRPHCGRDLTLLWDDPSRLPDPPFHMPS